MTWTDLTILAILTFLMINGVERGFLRSLLGPLALATSYGLGYSILFLSHNLPVALLVTIFGPFIFRWVLEALFADQGVENRVPLSMLSRISGAMINLTWGGAVVIVLVLTLAILPLKQLGLPMVRSDLKASLTYKLLKQTEFMKEPQKESSSREAPIETPTDCPDTACAKKQAVLQSLAQDEDIKELMTDERVKALTNDPALRKAVENKDYSGLLSSPAIKAILQDPALLAKFLKAYPKVQEQMDKVPDEE